MMIPTYSVTLPKNLICDREKTVFAEKALNKILELCQTEQCANDFVLKLTGNRAIWIYKTKRELAA